MQSIIDETIDQLKIQKPIYKARILALNKQGLGNSVD
jgi:hypothetical protein